MEPILIILFRWMHVATACVAVGGVFFMWIVFPAGLRVLEAEPARAMLLRTRSIFKRVIHTCILLLLISGTYNVIMNWPVYKQMDPAVGHSLLGTHILLALISFTIALWLLAGAEPRANHKKWTAINLAILLLTIAVASALKYAREHRSPKPVATVSAISETISRKDAEAQSKDQYTISSLCVPLALRENLF